MPFTYDLSPVIVQLGPFALRWYSLVYVAGFLLAYWLLVRWAKRGVVENLDIEGAEELVVWLILGTLVGARLTYALVYNPAYFAAAPWKIVALWEGGMSFHGGFVGAALGAWIFCRRKKVRFLALGDLLMAPLSLMLVFGRIANFVNGELPGTVTSVPWCINYPNNPAIQGCRHPSQFYEAGHQLLLFLILAPLAYIDYWRKRLREGTVLWLFVLLYGLGRFLTDFYREPDPTPAAQWIVHATGIQAGQWLSLAMAVIGAAALAWLYWPGKKRAEKKKRRN